MCLLIMHTVKLGDLEESVETDGKRRLQKRC